MKKLVLFILMTFALNGHCSQFYWIFHTQVGSLNYWREGTGQGSEYYWKFGKGLASRENWIMGNGVGSKYHWDFGADLGSKYFWYYGKGPGSRHYWENGEGVGSKYFWKNGTEASFGPVITSLCMSGSIDIDPCTLMGGQSPLQSFDITAPVNCYSCNH